LRVFEWPQIICINVQAHCAVLNQFLVVQQRAVLFITLPMDHFCRKMMKQFWNMSLWRVSIQDEQVERALRDDHQGF
jgi:hypothetical protein